MDIPRTLGTNGDNSSENGPNYPAANRALIVGAWPDELSPALRAVSDAVLGVAANLSVHHVLQQLVHCARELADARYAALGIPDGDGGFSQFWCREWRMR